MSLTTLLGVAISLSFAYVLLSTIASTVNELIVGLLKSRAKGLRNAIEALVGGSDSRGRAVKSNLATEVYRHALVAGTATSGLPAYIPSRNFTLALLDAVIGNSEQPTLAAVQNAVRAMQPGPARQALATLLDDAGGDIAAFKASLDRWFDDAMDRVGGAYKRRAQWALLAIGLVLAAGLNVDTVRMVSVLMKEPKTLEATVAAATAYVEKADAAAKKVAEQVDGAAKDAAAAETVETIKQLHQRMLDEIDALTGSPLPVGWDACVETDTTKGACAEAVTLDNVLQGKAPLVPMLAGWLLTAIAVSFGAPFWFDLLNQFINLRSSGPKPVAPDPGKTPS